MSRLNLRSGFFRLCLVFSSLFGLVAFLGTAFDPTAASYRWPFIIAFTALPWVLYWIGVYIADGFLRRRS